MRVGIIGGGLTGLATAYYLAKARPDWYISLYEQEDRFGGKVKTKRIGDYAVEMGPDSYLGRKVALTELITELGLGDGIVANATGQSYVYDRAAFYPIPGGSIVGIPTEFIPFAKASLLTWSGKMRAGLDYFKGPYNESGDATIGDFFEYHLGKEVVKKLIEPLLAGIYGGDIYKLSLDATFPDFHQLERKHGNMVKGMLAMKKMRAGGGPGAGHPGPKPGAAQGSGQGGQGAAAGQKGAQTASGQGAHGAGAPKGGATVNTAGRKMGTVGMFRQLAGGLESIIDALVAQMPSNVELLKGTAVVQAEQRGDDGYTLVLQTKAGEETAVSTDKATADSTGKATVASANEGSVGPASEGAAASANEGEKAVLSEREVVVDKLIITTPPQAYKNWFVNDGAFDYLRSMEQSSCAIAMMGFDKKSFDGKLEGTGFVITRTTDTPLTACTYLSEKWPQNTPEDMVVLRVFIGKPQDQTVDTLDEEGLGKLALSEIQRIMGFKAQPQWLELVSLPHSMPQYHLGHGEEKAKIQAHVAEVYKGLYLIGTPFDGIGMPDGVKQAQALVSRLVEEDVDMDKTEDKAVEVLNQVAQGQDVAAHGAAGHGHDAVATGHGHGAAASAEPQIATGVETYEGWFSIHVVYAVDFPAWASAAASERKAMLNEFKEFRAALEAQHEAKTSSYGLYQVPGGKGDFMWWFLQPSLEAVSDVDTAFKKLRIAKYLKEKSSFVSVVEVSNYFKAPIDHPKVQARLYPHIPRKEYVCFYPMAKRRNLQDNWYMTPWADRKVMMRAHGATGRLFEDTIAEVTTGAIGLDDWEWGITLMSDDVVQFKKIVTQMRYDEVSARFGIFGAFTIGMYMTEDRLNKLFTV